MMIKYYDPDGDWCYRALHTAHAVFHNAEGKLIARAENPMDHRFMNSKSRDSN